MPQPLPPRLLVNYVGYDSTMAGLSLRLYAKVSVFIRSGQRYWAVLPTRQSIDGVVYCMAGMANVYYGTVQVGFCEYMNNGLAMIKIILPTFVREADDTTAVVMIDSNYDARDLLNTQEFVIRRNTCDLIQLRSNGRSFSDAATKVIGLPVAADDVTPRDVGALIRVLNNNNRRTDPKMPELAIVSGIQTIQTTGGRGLFLIVSPLMPFIIKFIKDRAGGDLLEVLLPVLQPDHVPNPPVPSNEASAMALPAQGHVASMSNTQTEDDTELHGPPETGYATGQ